MGTLPRKEEPEDRTWGSFTVVWELFQKIVNSLRGGALLEEADNEEQALMCFIVSPHLVYWMHCK